MRLVEAKKVMGLEPMRNGAVEPVEILRLSDSPYPMPVAITSDLHKDFETVLDVLETQLDPADWILIAAGDVSGTPVRGESGDPTRQYVRAHATYRKLYFVDGNHDRPGAEAYELRNSDGTPCCLQNGRGLVGDLVVKGVSGIVGRGNKPGSVAESLYVGALEEALLEENLHTLVTHDAPLVGGFNRPIGRRCITELLECVPPRVHIFGHCHLFPCFVEWRSILMINAHRRVVLLS